MVEKFRLKTDSKSAGYTEARLWSYHSGGWGRRIISSIPVWGYTEFQISLGHKLYVKKKKNPAYVAAKITAGEKQMS
jgi:hypothetical protein